MSQCYKRKGRFCCNGNPPFKSAYIVAYFLCVWNTSKKVTKCTIVSLWCYVKCKYHWHGTMVILHTIIILHLQKNTRKYNNTSTSFGYVVAVLGCTLEYHVSDDTTMRLKWMYHGIYASTTVLPCDTITARNGNTILVWARHDYIEICIMKNKGNTLKYCMNMITIRNHDIYQSTMTLPSDTITISL